MPFRPFLCAVWLTCPVYHHYLALQVLTPAAGGCRFTPLHPVASIGTLPLLLITSHNVSDGAGCDVQFGVPHVTNMFKTEIRESFGDCFERHNYQ